MCACSTLILIPCRTSLRNCCLVQHLAGYTLNIYWFGMRYGTEPLRHGIARWIMIDSLPASLHSFKVLRPSHKTTIGIFRHMSHMRMSRSATPATLNLVLQLPQYSRRRHNKTENRAETCWGILPKHNDTGRCSRDPTALWSYQPCQSSNIVVQKEVHIPNAISVP